MFNFSFRILSLGLMCLICSIGSYAFAQDKVVVIPMAGDDLRTVYEIGKTGPAGGIVFHVTDGGRHGLEAAHEDQGTGVWCPFLVDIASIANLSGGDVDPNTGQDNTIFMVVGGCGGAALLAYNYEGPNGITGPEGTSSWYLPNKEELDLLFNQKDVVGGFASNFYWSSSEVSSSAAWYQYFVNGNQFGNGSKSLTIGVRAVRAF